MANLEALKEEVWKEGDETLDAWTRPAIYNCNKDGATHTLCYTKCYQNIKSYLRAGQCRHAITAAAKDIIVIEARKRPDMPHFKATTSIFYHASSVFY